MIAGIFHEGSGLGNQLHRYVATRVLAADKGYEFTMYGAENFKGYSFLNPNLGEPITVRNSFDNVFNETKISHENGTDIRPYDPLWARVSDGTIIDGEFQAPEYFMHRIDEVRNWLQVDPLELKPNECVLAHRGGEYTYFPDLYLTEKYWRDAMAVMRSIRPDMTFRIVTDDPDSAQAMFPDLPVGHEIGHDWRSIRYAPYLILSNSSFGILPALLNENVKKILAPKYWARHNVSDGYWALPQNRYEQFTYLDREGNLS